MATPVLISLDSSSDEEEHGEGNVAPGVVAGADEAHEPRQEGIEPLASSPQHHAEPLPMPLPAPPMVELDVDGRDEFLAGDSDEAGEEEAEDGRDAETEAPSAEPSLRSYTATPVEEEGDGGESEYEEEGGEGLDSESGSEGEDSGEDGGSEDEEEEEEGEGEAEHQDAQDRPKVCVQAPRSMCRFVVRACQASKQCACPGCISSCLGLEDLPA